MSAGQEESTKSRRFRPVPLADQADAELRKLASREHFTAEADFVFCRVDGGPLDRSAVRPRFIKAQEAAGVKVRRFHDLRHTFGSLAIQKFDMVSVKDLMGHSKLTTTERYLHSKPRKGDAAKLTSVFAPSESVDT
jgi:integrase